MKNKQLLLATFLAVTGLSVYAESPIDESKNVNVKPFIDIMLGTFYSQKSYNNAELKDHVSWQEAYMKYGILADYKVGTASIYGSLKGVSSATWGDGDAGGMTNGTEHRTSLDEWTIGLHKIFQNNTELDVNVGRQSVQIADGFLVAGDALNIGKGIENGQLDRGGSYYLAARQSFDFTVVAKMKILDQLSLNGYYLKSNNKAQYEPKMWAIDSQYTLGKGELGFTYLKVLNVNDPYAIFIRKDLQNLAFRFKRQWAENIHVAGEYVEQKQKNQQEDAWYIATNYRFDQIKFQPTLGYRYSSFSENYDPLFYGNTNAGFGTWFQGEVAGNYAGPYSSNTRIHQLSLQSSMRENLQIGVLAYKFNTIKKTENLNLDGYETDLFAVWSSTPKINIIPLIGFYKPKADLAHGGSQINSKKTNTYAQILVQYLY